MHLTELHTRIEAMELARKQELLHTINLQARLAMATSVLREIVHTRSSLELVKKVAAETIERIERIQK